MNRRSETPRRPTGGSPTPEFATRDGQGLRLACVAGATLLGFGAVVFHQVPAQRATALPSNNPSIPSSSPHAPVSYPGAARTEADIRNFAERFRQLQEELDPDRPSPALAMGRSTKDPFAVGTQLVRVLVCSESAAHPRFEREYRGGPVAAPNVSRAALGNSSGALRPPANPRLNTEDYAHLPENRWTRAADQSLSTFSVDVDTASYSNVRHFLRSDRLPPIDAVRIEEMINYFSYDYPASSAGTPFSVALEVHSAPWQPGRRLVRIGLRGREIAFENRPVANLVFLVDVSGSMAEPNKLPLVQRSLRLLVDRLAENDRVAMVVYAGSSGVVLPSTTGNCRDEILAAIDRLQAGGSTNGGAGIRLAYRLAEEHFVRGGVNRVLLCTDGDFNVGPSSEGELVRLIEEERKSGVFLSVLGFGTGNYADSRMQALADQGNGNAYYIDGLSEARKVLVEQASGTLITIAKDVKLQVEFNPAKVAGYRLIGYENRMLEAQDFNDDRKDAGEIGAGHQVTALYEVVPVGGEVPGATMDSLEYRPREAAPRSPSDELLTVKLRWKAPDGDSSARRDFPLVDPGVDREEPSEDFHFAASVAMFGMLLRDSEHRGRSSYALAIELAKAGLADDTAGHRREFVELAERARRLAGRE